MLLVKALAGLVFLLVALGLALFLPAATIDYWQAWTFLAVFGTETALITIFLAHNDRGLLERRVRAGPTAEVRLGQKIIQFIAQFAFLSLFLVSAFDRRHGWSHLPVLASIVGDVLVASGLFTVFQVFRANSFTSATIEIGAGQRVVSTGPYALVRHPMYSGAFVMLAGTPLALGSWWAFAGLPAMVLIIVLRLFDEERFLEF